MVSLIIIVDGNSKNLPAVLKSLRHQTFECFEVIIAQGGSSETGKLSIEASALTQTVKHVCVEDKVSQTELFDRAIHAAGGNYLIFIKGNSVLHHKFMEEHKRLSDPDGIVTGSAIVLGPSFTQFFLHTEADFLELEKKIEVQHKNLKADGAQALEEGVYINPTGFQRLFKSLHTARKLNIGNMSFYKSTYEEIRGFFLVEHSVDTLDVTLQRCFAKEGFSLRSARNFAVQYNLALVHLEVDVRAESSKQHQVAC